MNMRLALVPLCLLSAVSVMGCTAPEEDSCNIKTGGIYVEYEVFEEGNQARATATFWVGDKPGGTYLSLGSCGDNITVNGQGMSKKTDNVNHDYYEAKLGKADSYEFVFTREDEDPYSSSVSPRKPVNITAPTSGTSISRADAFEITWENNDSGKIELLIEGDCIEDFPSVNGDDVADTGSYSVNADGIKPFMKDDADKTCSASLSLTRKNSGSLSPSLKEPSKATPWDTQASRRLPEILPG